MDELYPTKLLAFSSQQIEAMLRTVEVLHETSIVSPVQLRCIGPYTFAEIRLAIALRVFALLTKGERTMIKQLGEGKQVRITLLRSFDKQTSLPQSIELSVSGREKYIFEVLFPILEPGENLLGNCIQIVDFRTKPDQFAFLSDMQKKGATPNDIRLLWKGLRFLCRTLREWEKPGITWPEDMEGDV